MEKITQLFDTLLKKYARSDEGESDDLRDLQITLFFLIFLATTIFGTISCATSVALTIYMKKYETALFYFSVLLTFVLVTFGRFLKFYVRAWTGLSTYYILGFINLIQIGPSGSGISWLFSFAIIACLTLGLKAGFIALAINMLTFLMIGLMLKAGYIIWQYSPGIQFHHFLTVSITSTTICATILIPIAIFIANREKRLLSEISMTESLRKLNMQYLQQILERKQIEKALGESEEKFSKAFRTSPAIMALISQENTCFLDINDKFVEIFDLKAQDIIGEPITKLNILLEESEKPCLGEMIQRNKTVKNCEISFTKKDSTAFQGLLSSDRITLKGKDYILMMIIDISDLKKNEKTLKNNNQYLGRLVEIQSKELAKTKFELETTKAIATNLLNQKESVDSETNGNKEDM